MGIKKRIKIPIFDFKLTVVITKNIEKYGEENDMELSYTKACVFKNNCGGILAIFDKDKTTYSTIAHECVHIVNEICKWVGIKLDADNDEVQAYLTSYVFEKIEKLWKQKK